MVGEAGGDAVQQQRLNIVFCHSSATTTSKGLEKYDALGRAAGLDFILHVCAVHAITCEWTGAGPRGGGQR